MWLVAIGFAGVNFVLVLFEKQTVLRTELETEFGLETKAKSDSAPTQLQMKRTENVEELQSWRTAS